MSLGSTNACTEPVVHILDAAVWYFEGRQIGVEHLMASSAIPIVFPWEEIDGYAYWEGGLVVNTPLLPAIQRRASEVIVVLFVPITRGLSGLRVTRRRAFGWIFEVSTLASAESVILLLLLLHSKPPLREALPRQSPITSGRISLLHFEATQIGLLFDAGYRDARDQLGSVLGQVSPVPKLG